MNEHLFIYLFSLLIKILNNDAVHKNKIWKDCPLIRFNEQFRLLVARKIKT